MMDIEISIGEARVAGRLLESKTALDFASLLPLSLTLSDFASAEKIAYLPRKLDVRDAPPGCGAKVGDICYYAPWGNVALFYEPARYADGLVRLGSLEGATELLRGARRITVALRSA